MASPLTTASYIPLFLEVHIDLSKSGILVPRGVKFSGKDEPCMMAIDTKHKKISYYTREKSELIWSVELQAAYHADPMPGIGNGFTMKFRQDKSLIEVNHLLAGCTIDYRQDRDFLIFLLRTTQSREGLMEYYLKKFYGFPHEFLKGNVLLKDDDKKAINVVSTTFNTLVFVPAEATIPRRAFLYNTWEMASEPKKCTVTCVWHPPDDVQYKKQRDEWNNKKSRYIFRCESAEQCAQVVQRLTVGRRNLASRPVLPLTVDALKEEMFEEQRKLIMAPVSQSPGRQTQSLTTSALSPGTPMRRETLSLEQQQLQHQQRARSSAFQQTTIADLITTPSPSATPPVSGPTTPLASSSPLTSGRSTGKRSTLFAQAKVSVVPTPQPLFAPIQEDLPPPPPVEEEDLPPPPPPDLGSPQHKFTPAPPPPDDDDDDMPPPPPPGIVIAHDLPPPPPPGSSGEVEADDDDDDEPPPPSGFKGKSGGFKAATEFVIQDEVKLQPLTPRSSSAIEIQMELPPAPNMNTDDMPLQALNKNVARSRASSQYPIGELLPSNQHQSPSNPDVNVQIREEGDWVKEIRTEIITDPNTGQRQQRITETTTNRAEYFRNQARSRGASFAPQSLIDNNIPQYPCPVGCKYQYTSKNPLTRQSQLLMDDAVLGILDPNFRLPFTSIDGQVVYGVLPDESCGLDSNFIITSNGLIVECRVNGIITLEDSVLAQVTTETPIHLLGTSIARQGQTLAFLAQGCVPGSEVEMERFQVPDDEEMPGPPIEHIPLPPAPAPSSLLLPPTPVVSAPLSPRTPLSPLSIDLSYEPSSAMTPLATPSGGAFHFGVTMGVEFTVKLEGQEDPIGVIEIPAEADPTQYFFNQLRDQLLDELDDLPEEFCFLIKGAKLNSKQEAKKAVATLTEPLVTIRDVKKWEQQKAAEEAAKRLEEERQQKAVALAAGPGRSAPIAPPRGPPRAGNAPQPPPGAPRGVPPGSQPPPGAPRGVPPGSQPPPGAPRGVPPGSRPPQAVAAGSPNQAPVAPPANRPVISMAALQGGASALRKAPLPEDKVKPPDLLSQIKLAAANKGAPGGIKLNKVNHEQLQKEKDMRNKRGSLASGGGMFVSIKAAMASRREATVDDAADDTDDDWD